MTLRHRAFLNWTDFEALRFFSFYCITLLMVARVLCLEALSHVFNVYSAWAGPASIFFLCFPVF
jgi:hypothetical protein